MKVRSLAGVVAPGAGLVVAPVVDQAAEVLAVLAVDPVVLEGFAVQQPVADRDEAVLIRAEQPLVTGAHQQVRLQAVEVEGQGADRLRAVDDEQGADLARPLADGFQIKGDAVRPVDVRERHRRGIAVDGFQNPRAPRRCRRRAVRAVHQAQFSAAAVAGGHPAVDVAGKFLCRNDHVLPGPQRRVVDRHGDAVTGRGDAGDAVRRGVDEAGKAVAQGFHRLEEVRPGDVGG